MNSWKTENIRGFATVYFRKAAVQERESPRASGGRQSICIPRPTGNVPPMLQLDRLFGAQEIQELLPRVHINNAAKLSLTQAFLPFPPRGCFGRDCRCQE